MINYVMYIKQAYKYMKRFTSIMQCKNNDTEAY